MKHTAFIALLLVFAVSISGCVNQSASPGTNATTGTGGTGGTGGNGTGGTGSAGTVGMDQIYKYGSLSSFEYKITTVADGQTSTMNLLYHISSDSVNGTAAWLQETTMSTQAGNVVTKMWLDKSSYRCLKITTVMDIAGQHTEQASDCPAEGVNSGAQTTQPQLTKTGIESVTVPAGTFSCDKYTVEGMTFWTNSGVPVPVKYTAGDATMELVSYS